MTRLHTHHACPADGPPCWSRRECEHVEDGVKACVRRMTDKYKTLLDMIDARAKEPASHARADRR